ncbi:ArsR/SmtB family transcription factor [Pengzhenrongella phosphoraccumulans]|uniref:ArsR/SmtB family transcription factor n=1 Tax=Pengzhenrongella phosphoraccumulans TaxID=3114394 RepID=UPI00388FB918
MNADKHGEKLDEDQVLLAVEVFRMLADPTRVQLLWALIGREQSVNELATQVGKPGPAVSQHLAKLRLGRLVQTRRDGTSVYYRITNEHIEQLITDAVFNAEHASVDIPVHHRERAASPDAPGAQSSSERGTR